MPSAPRNPSKVVARLLWRRRKELGLTLRQVEEATAEAGQPVPFSTLAKIEHGKIDPGLKRLALLMRLYKIPFQMAGDLVDLEELAEECPPERDPEILLRNGLEHWRQGDLRKGLAHLLTLRELTPSDPPSHLARQQALLSFAIVANSLGKVRLSRQIVDDLLIEPPDASLLVNVLVQAGVVWRGLGSMEASMAFFDRAVGHLEPGNHKQSAWVFHGKAKTLLLAGYPDQAGTVLGKALHAYRQAEDRYGESLALGIRVQIQRARGDAEGTLKAARIGRRHAERYGFARVALHRRLEEGRALQELGRSSKGLGMLTEALTQALADGDHQAEFYAHYHLWKMYAALGEKDRARIEQDAACYFVRYVDEVTEETTEIRALSNQLWHSVRGNRRGTIEKA